MKNTILAVMLLLSTGLMAQTPSTETKKPIELTEVEKLRITNKIKDLTILNYQMENVRNQIENLRNQIEGEVANISKSKNLDKYNFNYQTLQFEPKPEPKVEPKAEATKKTPAK